MVPTVKTLSDVQAIYHALKNSCETQVQGRSDVIDLILVALFADGHVLLEDHPGSGKTTLAKALGGCIHRATNSDPRFAAFRRIQFTPDLLPSDVTGTTVFDPNRNQLTYQPGPVFANIVLADEINRTSPKVQSSMLEAMAEKQVTVDNVTHPLEDTFLVLATQNPLDQAGTYPLPKAQLDRFLFKIRMTFLSRDHELQVLAMKYPQCREDGHATSAAQSTREPDASPPLITPESISQARKVIQDQIKISRSITESLVEIAGRLRADPRVAQGISTRALVVTIPALQARAMMYGRDFVIPDDLKALSLPVFSHRLELQPGIASSDTIVEEVTLQVIESLCRDSLK
ncbi:AAA family ATPase [Neorhodopirellula pilleata]|uniref:ATPase RavA n=1 Tax=Neorhodopirellula pilleata TaxID=2714738 RepID=A0A5C5ZZV1_9BACT|nr:AAA family ATPase [Neorhodopirellula pilleata]TWT91873.1 ATPase RavA [Neorhodopirellula pilleata]